MSAGQYDFKIEQGSSFKMSLVYKDRNGRPINLTGWCARLTWRTNNNTTQIFSSANVDHGVYNFIIDEPVGKLTLLIPASTTDSFNFHSAKYDLELQSPDELYNGGGKFTTRILFGTINLIKRFSQSSGAINCNNG